MNLLPFSTRFDDDEHKANRDAMEIMMADYHKRIKEVFQAGGEKSISKHRSREKKLARERIDDILDQGSPFLELSPMAAMDMYGGTVHSAGIVTGIGRISGRLCMIVANDATVKGGTYFPMTVKKHLRAQEIAMENRLPCVYLVDSGGAFLPMQADVFPDKEHFGRIFYNQANLSAAGIPQISAVLGSCTAGGAYVPAMSDETVIVKRNGTIFLGGPPLVKAATGEDVTDEELGGADVHTRLSGVADHFAENEPEALEMVRTVISTLGMAGQDEFFPTDIIDEIEEPVADPNDLLSLVPSNNRTPMVMREVLARILDGSKIQEFKARYGQTLICGFARIGGHLIGLLANDGILFSESSLKGAHFIELCNQRRIPLLFFQNITGFMVGKKAENEGIAKNGAKLVTAVSTATVPKITVIVGGSYGAGNYGMCGRAYDPRFLFMWPNSKISVMGGEQAANVLTQVKVHQLKTQGAELSASEIEEFKRPILEKYESESSCYYSTARLWDDGVIDPLLTRQTLILALEACLNRNMDRGLPPLYRM